ncbi:protein binding protein [Rhizoctonia solani AG-1 IA]|uniref:Protein binding protein n=1 Tax=Thanatephorus cucumeris (strain AG1-IA) TaxID=983506 RepID=L8WM14_THACA|nr:protein binding protein [Rhizoctonia solani AG-1 IA]
MSYDKLVYDEPEKFNPDRFLNPKTPSPPTFGFGRRSCPGIHLAESTLFITISTLLALFEIRPIKDKDGNDVIPEVNMKTNVLVSHQIVEYIDLRGIGVKRREITAVPSADEHPVESRLEQDETSLVPPPPRNASDKRRTAMNPNWRPGGQPQQQQQQQYQQQQQQIGGFGGGLQPQATGFPQQRSGFLGPQQTGFQPQQTGFQPQQTGFQPQQTGFQPQQTGFQQQGFQQQPGFQAGLQPQATGFPGLQPQATGFPGQRPGFGQQPSGVPPVPPLPQGLQQQAQQQRFLSASPALVPQATGWQGAGGGLSASPLAPQMTGFHDPRVQMMTNTFMPAANFQPNQGGALQFAGGPQHGQSLQQSIQQHNEEQRGTAAPRIPWKLTRDEQKNYDQIFRAWDQGSTGFISGQVALEVFGQSGLSREDLAKICVLCLTRFLGLNGNEIPDVLPPELVPASARDLGDQVGFLKDLLKNDTHTRATNAPTSRAPQRSFHDAGPTDRKDGTVYRHDDTDVKGYKSAARHIDRSRVRFGDDSPSSDLADMKRQLENASKALDKAAARDQYEDDLDQEMDELKSEIRRVQDDLDYVSRGPRSVSKDEERRKLERKLLALMHERIPEVERKIEDRDRRRRDDDRDWARERDKRNQGGSYRDRDRDRDDYDRDRDRDRYDRDPPPFA